MMALFNYLLLTNFFWMLVEGLYLHTVIVWTFSVDYLRLRHYAALGWGPCSIILIFIIISSFFLMVFFSIIFYVLLVKLMGDLR